MFENKPLSLQRFCGILEDVVADRAIEEPTDLQFSPICSKNRLSCAIENGGNGALQ
jgi:hypothetical protein